MKKIYAEAFIYRSKNRKKILLALKSGKKIQAELHKATGMYRTHVRRTLLELQGKKLIQCLNPRDRIAKFYELTKKGRELI